MSLGGLPTAGLLVDTTRPNLVLAWRERIEEAEHLIAAGHVSMAICLKAYGLEARVKLRICEHLGLDLLPMACKTHDLGQLVIFTGLFDELKAPANTRVLELWLRLATFSKERLNATRYQPRSQLAATDARSLLEAFDDPVEGAFAWLSRPR